MTLAGAARVLNIKNVMEKIIENQEKLKQTILLFEKQAQAAWQKTQALDLSLSYQTARALVICGMGGSILAGKIVEGLHQNNFPVPLTLISDYHLPSFVDDKTLVILSSFSGETEETLSCLKEAEQKNAFLIGITARSESSLVKFFQERTLPVLVFGEEFNPTQHANFSIIYSLFAHLFILERLSFARSGSFSREVFTGGAQPWEKLAQDLAQEIQNRIPIFIAAEHLTGLSLVFQNLLQENAKTFAAGFNLPDLNHHLLEGLSNPPSLKENLIFVFLESPNYSPQILKRLKLTKEVVEKNKIQVEKVDLRGESKLEEVICGIGCASWLTYHLSQLNQIDPLETPWVEYFKEKLLKKSHKISKLGYTNR